MYILACSEAEGNTRFVPMWKKKVFQEHPKRLREDKTSPPSIIASKLTPQRLHYYTELKHEEQQQHTNLSTSLHITLEVSQLSHNPNVASSLASDHQ